MQTHSLQQAWLQSGGKNSTKASERKHASLLRTERWSLALRPASKVQKATWSMFQSDLLSEPGRGERELTCARGRAREAEDERKSGYGPAPRFHGVRARYCARAREPPLPSDRAPHSPFARAPFPPVHGQAPPPRARIGRTIGQTSLRRCETDSQSQGTSREPINQSVQQGHATSVI